MGRFYKCYLHLKMEMHKGCEKGGFNSHNRFLKGHLRKQLGLLATKPRVESQHMSTLGFLVLIKCISPTGTSGTNAFN